MARYWWVAVTPVAVPPSPNVHAYVLIVPSGSPDPAPDTDTASSGGPVTAIAAVGSWFGAVTTALPDASAVPPSSSVTVTVTG